MFQPEAWAPLTSLDSATSAFLLATRSFFCPDSPLLQHSLPDCRLEAMAQEDISHSQNKMWTLRGFHIPSPESSSPPNSPVQSDERDDPARWDVTWSSGGAGRL